MVSILSYTNAFPGIPFPNHLSGQSKPQSFLFPGAVQPTCSPPTVLSYTAAFPGIPFPNHLSGQSQPQSFLYPGAVQPTQPPGNPAVPGQFITIYATFADQGGGSFGSGYGHNP